ncbi:hypothetical protein [Leptospira yasudae]|uniref:Uncharacterized protein n=1 Tax=Leptospira yasudae TaxID=2202201 RepID=A0A6N4QWC8_9LEPT|nr:hypothetical protein EHQ77_09250 [Leptospira yasudae]TGL80196.1 hypothetical protein EHQ83_16965 [Leptospira yasudae]TGL81091.1 hypothetical protein EHQ72_06355 [Leptospira yasudae]
MFESSGIIDILHSGILDSIFKIGLNAQFPSKKFDKRREVSILTFRFAVCKRSEKPEKTEPGTKTRETFSNSISIFSGHF